MSHNLPINLMLGLGSEPKVAKSVAEAWEMQSMFDNPSGWIDLSQSDVCVEFFCVCGSTGHIDDKLPELVVCGGCQRQYFVNGHIQLIEILPIDDPPYIGN